MQLGHRPGPAASLGLFLPLVPRDAGMDAKGGRRSGAAPGPRCSRTMPGTAAPIGPGASGTRRLRLLGDPARARGIPPLRSLRPTRVPSSQRKAGMRRSSVEWGPAQGRWVWGLSPSAQRPPIPRASSPTVWERNSLERNKSQRHEYFSSYKWLRDSSREQDHQSRDAQLLDPQHFSYTFSPFSYSFHNTPASPFHPPLSSRLLQPARGCISSSRCAEI